MEERKRERIVFDKFQSQFCRFLKEFSLEKWKLQLFCDLQLDQHVKKSSSMNKGFNHFSPSSFIPQFLHGVRSSNETFCQMEKKAIRFLLRIDLKTFSINPCCDLLFSLTNKEKTNLKQEEKKEGGELYPELHLNLPVLKHFFNVIYLLIKSILHIFCLRNAFETV